MLYSIILCQKKGGMKIFLLILEKIYWITFLSSPLLMAYAHGAFPSSNICNADGICFEYGGAIIRWQVELIFYFSVLSLLPMGIWQIIGRHVVVWRQRGNAGGLSALPNVARAFGVIYWLLIASIPLLFWYVFGTFMAPHSCDVDRNCFQFYMPLSAESRAAVLIACCILWPLCAWKLFEAVRRIRKGQDRKA